MSSTIEFDLSKMEIRFRVIRITDSTLLFSSISYGAAEHFCWKYDGPGELEIKKVWINK